MAERRGGARAMSKTRPDCDRSDCTRTAKGIPGHWPTPVPEALAVAEPVTLVSKTIPFSFLLPPPHERVLAKLGRQAARLKVPKRHGRTILASVCRLSCFVSTYCLAAAVPRRSTPGEPKRR